MFMQPYCNKKYILTKKELEGKTLKNFVNFP